MVLDETWVSVDVETSGATPSTGSLISIGACLVDAPDRTFSIELRPVPGMPWEDAAERIHGLTRDRLERDGVEPADGIRAFVEWVETETAGTRPVFVAFNATFDWMFVADYAWRYVGRNPFGVSGLDIKALYLGRHLDHVRRWGRTGSDDVGKLYGSQLPHTHLALDDALQQADVCRRILESARRDGDR